MTKRPKMTKNQYQVWISIYIIDISIYLDLPREEQTDRCSDCQIKTDGQLKEEQINRWAY